MLCEINVIILLIGVIIQERIDKVVEIKQQICERSNVRMKQLIINLSRTKDIIYI